MRHRYVAEQTLVSASLLSFRYVHVAAGEYCMAFTRQQKMRDAAASAALPLHLRPRIRQSCASRRSGGRRGTSSAPARPRSEEHTSELQSLMRTSYAVFCLKKKKTKHEQIKDSLKTSQNTTQ